MVSKNLTKAEQKEFSVKEEQILKEIGFWLPKRKLFAEKVLLRDYQPKSTLKISEHLPQRAKFPAFDFHTHIFHPSIIDTDQITEGLFLSHFFYEPDEILRTMDKVGLEKVVNAGCGMGKTLDNFLNTYVRPYPNRFIAFASFNWDRLLQHKNFGKLAAKELEQAVDKGARGSY
jgi:hypothetical protein